jgi:hypothetical protein
MFLAILPKKKANWQSLASKKEEGEIASYYQMEDWF